MNSSNQSKPDLKSMFREFQQHYSVTGARHWAAASDSEGRAVDLGKVTVNACLLLNGGAIIAVPTFVQMLEASNTSAVTNSIILFVMGLVAALIAALSGFFAMSNRGSQRFLEARAEEHRAWSNVLMSNKSIDLSKAENRNEQSVRADARFHFMQYLIWRFGAILATLLSVLFFIIGALFGISVIRG